MPLSRCLILCSFIGITQADTYGSLQRLHSVLEAPHRLVERFQYTIRVYHASFTEYLISPPRLGEYCLRDIDNLVINGAVALIFKKSHNESKHGFEHGRCPYLTVVTAESTVQVSRICVSWLVAGRSLSFVQKRLFTSASCFLLIPLVLDSNSPLSSKIWIFSSCLTFVLVRSCQFRVAFQNP